MKKLIIFTLMIIVSINLAQAATIHGNVYDFYLNKVIEGKVTISTEPLQQIVLENSEYSFEVEAGQYEITGYQMDQGHVISQAKETIIVSKDGTYQIDLILFPSFEEEEILQETEQLQEPEIEFSKFPVWLFFIGFLIILAGLFILAYLKFKKLKPVLFGENLDPELEKVLKFIKKQKRTTQKQIRKEFPLSEGKISLMITELEKKNLVKKIKKGRGNIIVIK